MAKYFEAISVNPGYAPAYYNIAVVYSEFARYEEALKYYQAAIHHNKFYFEAYCNLGVIYKNVGQLETAIAFYEKALAVNPNFTIAKNNLAIALTDYGTKLKTDAKVCSLLHYKISQISSNFPHTHQLIFVLGCGARSYRLLSKSPCI